MCIICSDMSGQFRRTEFLPEDVATGRVGSGQRAWGDAPLGFLDLDDRGGLGPNGKTSLLPGDAGGQITRTNQSWASGLGQAATVTYSYRSTAQSPMPSDTSGFTRFTDAQIIATELMLAAWAEVAQITFQRVGSGTSGEGAYSDESVMLFGNYSAGASGAAAFAYLPGNTAHSSNSGNVWVNSSLAYNSAPTYLAYGYQVLLHEIGHAIGLSHPADYNAGAGVSITYSDHAQYYEDSRQYTVMSYFSEGNTGGAFAGRYASAPLLDDIAAAQRLYGANMTTRTGDTVYGFNSTAGRIWYDATQGGSGSAVVFAVWDAGGTDTLDFSGYSANGLIDLRQGHFSSVGGLTGNVSVAMGAVIENAIGGSGADTLVGNSAANQLRGNAGNDTIDGGVGSDTAVYSGAQASYTVTAGTETIDGVAYRIVTVTGPEGTDVLRNIEFIAFSDGTIAAPIASAGIIIEGDATADTINGTAFADRINGGGGNDSITGGDGNDRINGGLGNDTLDGGAGVDTVDYTGSISSVVVDLSANSVSGGGGTDTISNFENIIGSRHNDTLTGTAGDNRIEGGGGIDSLNGGGGNDVLVAGAGSTTSPPAPDVVKAQATANTSIPAAVNIDANFDLINDAGFTNPTTVPHAKITATTNGGGKEYYAFTVGAGVTATFDINGGTFDTVIEIFDANGTRLSINDDGGGDGTNSYLSQAFATAGTYYIAVSLWVSGSGNSIVTASPPAGGAYSLNISIPGHAVAGQTFAGSTLNGGDGDDMLHSGSGDDTMNGGAGTDTAVYAGARTLYTITDLGGGSFRVTGPDGTGTDTLNGVERIQFSDQTVTVIAPSGPNVINGSTNGETLNGTAGVDHIYGFDGDDVMNGLGDNDLLIGGGGNDTMSGGTGNDTYEVTEAGDVVVENTGEGNDTVYSYLNGYALTANVENLSLVGSAVAGYGNNLDNLITGNGLDNVLVGGAGNDTMTGGAGNDTYEVTEAGDVVVENAGEGNDTVFSSVTGYVLSANVETLVMTGLARSASGNSGDNIIIGNHLDNIIYTGGGNDVIDGGAGGDTVVFSGAFSSYNITVNADNSRTVSGLGQTVVIRYVERLQFSDQRVDFVTAVNAQGTSAVETLQGSDIEDTLYGYGGDDSLIGYGGNDLLIGGTGADRMYGGDGDDTYEVDNVNDLVFEAAGEGTDTVFSYANGYRLNDNVERLILVGSAAVGFGNAGANSLTGNALDNTLVGGGGADTMIGGAGNDTYEVDEAGDVVVENAGEGIDSVFSYADSFALGANIENLTLVGSARVGIGNAGANVIVGNASANVLIGGAGADLMFGGLGDDAYEVTETGDAVVENAGEGNDTVYSYLSSYTLGANVENLVLAGSAVVGVGNSAGNSLTGNALANTLNGESGNDWMTGGGGRDTFWYLAGSGQDLITDFDAANNEVIVLSSSQFANFAAVQAAMTQAGSNVMINAGAGQSLTVAGVTIAQLTAANFSFYSGPSSAPDSEAALVLPGLADEFLTKPTYDEPLISLSPDAQTGKPDILVLPAEGKSIEPLVLPGLDDGFLMKPTYDEPLISLGPDGRMAEPDILVLPSEDKPSEPLILPGHDYLSGPHPELPYWNLEVRHHLEADWMI